MFKFAQPSKWSCLLLTGLLCLALNSPLNARCADQRPTPIANAGKKSYPIATFLIALLKRDIVGAIGGTILIQGLYSTNGLLEMRIGKTRPCGCNGSFPSGHMIMMSASSSFLWIRYGWRWGLPPMIGAFLFMADRVNAKAHGWDDVTGTAILYHFITWIFITRRGRRWFDKWRFFKTPQKAEI